MECFFRSEGFEPELSDSMGLWSKERAAIDTQGNNHDMVVLAGASRMQLGFNTVTFREMYPEKKMAHLAINGKPSVAVLRDIAENSDFRGLFLLSVTAGGLSPQSREFAQPHVSYYHTTYQPSIDRQLDFQISCVLQANLVVLQQQLSSRRLLRAVIKQELPQPSYLRINADRSMPADYSKIPDLEAHRAKRVQRHQTLSKKTVAASPTEWSKYIFPVAKWINAIQDRGGRVVLIRFPAAEESWTLDEKCYPKHLYWDQLEHLTSAKTLHFLDMPGVKDFELPDTSHLDASDTEEFTKILLRSLVEINVIESPNIPGR